MFRATRAPWTLSGAHLVFVAPLAILALSTFAVSSARAQGGGFSMGLQPVPRTSGFPTDWQRTNTLTNTVIVRNLGDGAANGGTVSAVLQVDGAEATRREFPVTIPAKGLTTLVWPLSAPNGKSFTTVATANIANDANAGNNQAQATSAIQVMLMRQVQPYIQMK